MNNKLKLFLITLEVVALLVLILLGVGCQKRWIIITGDGPRFDWYSVKEDLVPDLGSLLGSSNKETEPEEDTTVEPETTRPVTTEPPATTLPSETTQPPANTGNGTESNRYPEDDRWGLGRY